MRTAALFALTALVLSACESMTEPPGPEFLELELSAVISVGTYDGEAGFYFLPPMVKDPTYGGSFDPEVQPVVEICEEGTTCEESPHVRFSMEGRGSTVVRVDVEEERYLVNWHTRTTGAEAGRRYTVRVLEAGFELGSADVYVVRTGKDKKTLPDGAIGLVAGQTLPVAFRIEVDRERPAPPEPDIEIQPSTITAGWTHSCGLDIAGVAYCWGRNTNGLGTASITTSSTPMMVTMPEGVTFTAISAGSNHTVALDAMGAVYAWGLGTSGQLGDGGTGSSRTPVAVAMPEGVTFTMVVAGANYTVALATSGEVFGWGKNDNGQLGNGVIENASLPARVDMPVGVSFAVVDAGWDHTVALTTAGQAFAWGNNTDGRLGAGLDNPVVTTPVRVESDVAFTVISAGGAHTVALTAAGEAYAWGDNGDGQLGTGGTSGTSVPARVQTDLAFASVSAGSRHTLALDPAGAAFGWGQNSYLQLGNESNVGSTVPVAVVMPSEEPFTVISAGLLHSLAVTTSGAAYGWGENFRQQLGDGTRTDRSKPSPVSGDIAFQT